MPISGIDPGTSNSAAAVLRGRRPVIRSSAEGITLGGKALPRHVAVRGDGLDRPGQGLRIAVVDFGGRTRGITVMEFDKSVLEVKAMCGNILLGGTEMDRSRGSQSGSPGGRKSLYATGQLGPGPRAKPAAGHASPAARSRVVEAEYKQTAP